MSGAENEAGERSQVKSGAESEKRPVILFRDAFIAVCVKPAGMLSHDAPGGMPEYLRKATNKEVFCVHRLDRDVSGLCVYALTPKAASLLSAQMAEGQFVKEYLAVVHGAPQAAEGRMEDLLYHDMRSNKTFVTDKPRRGVREAALEYKILQTKNGLSLVQVHLLTGRTHQIRAQFASRKLPLCGDRRYGSGDDGCANIALFSHRLGFVHPKTGEALTYTALPEITPPWNLFEGNLHE